MGWKEMKGARGFCVEAMNRKVNSLWPMTPGDSFLFLIGFYAVITFSVIYNALRISLYAVVEVFLGIAKSLIYVPAVTLYLIVDIFIVCFWYSVQVTKKVTGKQK